MILLMAEHLDLIKRHGERTYPEEGCGVLVGRTNGGTKIVEEVRPTENARLDSRHNRYLIPPDDILRLERQARARGCEVVGFFHSHPDHPARPSEYDRDHAWPWYSYIIVAVAGGLALDVRSWVLTDDRSHFEPEDIGLAEAHTSASGEMRRSQGK
jgi:proteasome lid subunit RPN8/RPN11